jgi:hypothetical protein
MHEPIAYTYEADHHCEACTVARFGSTEGTDNEGNEVGAVFSWDEWYQVDAECEALACGDCHAILDNAHTFDCEQNCGETPCTLPEHARI